MQVIVEQRGGYAGVPMRRRVDTSDLPAEQAAEVQALVAQADVFTMSEPAPVPRRGYDMHAYRLTVEDGERKRTVHVQEGAIPEPLLPLMSFMQKVRPEA